MSIVGNGAREVYVDYMIFQSFRTDKKGKQKIWNKNCLKTRKLTTVIARDIKIGIEILVYLIQSITLLYTFWQTRKTHFQLKLIRKITINV